MQQLLRRRSDARSRLHKPYERDGVRKRLGMRWQSRDFILTAVVAILGMMTLSGVVLRVQFESPDGVRRSPRLKVSLNKNLAGGTNTMRRMRSAMKEEFASVMGRGSDSGYADSVVQELLKEPGLVNDFNYTWAADRLPFESDPDLGNETMEIPRRTLVIGTNSISEDSPVWNMNSRVVTEVGPICVDFDNVVHDFSPPEGELCEAFHVDGTREESYHPDSDACREIHRAKVASMYVGWVKEKDKSWIASRKNLKWHKPAVIVPDAPFLNNICHYNRLLSFVSFLLRNSERFSFGTLHTTQFISPWVLKDGWHRAMTRAVGMYRAAVFHLQGPIKANNLETDHCFQRALVLGVDGRRDSLQFLNDSSIISDKDLEADTHIPSVSIESLHYRKMVFASLGIPPLPISSPRRGLIDLPLPPKRIGVSERKEGDQRHFEGLLASQFEPMLHLYAQKYGFELVNASYDGKSPRDQVELAGSLGFVVGIHGANHQNSIFSPPGGALLELFPWRYVYPYYMAGGNAGLRYSFVEQHQSSLLPCIPPRPLRHPYTDNQMFCDVYYRQRPLNYSHSEIQDVRKKVIRAMIYINTLHEMGSTVRYRVEGDRLVMVKANEVRKVVERAWSAEQKQLTDFDSSE